METVVMVKDSKAASENLQKSSHFIFNELSPKIIKFTRNQYFLTFPITEVVYNTNNNS